MYVVYVVYVVRVFEGTAGSLPSRGRGRVRHLLGEGVHGSFRARARVALLVDSFCWCAGVCG